MRRPQITRVFILVCTAALSGLPLGATQEPIDYASIAKIKAQAAEIQRQADKGRK